MDEPALLKRCNQALFLEGSERLGADLERYFFAVDNQSFLLEVRLPNFFSVALRKADIVAKLFAFAGDVTYTHYVSFDSRSYFSGFYILSQ
jgi:hypothetical protein